MEHSNSRTFQGLSKAWIFLLKFKDFQGLLKDPMNPVEIIKYHQPLRYNDGSVSVPSIPPSGISQIRIFASSHATDNHQHYT